MDFKDMLIKDIGIKRYEHSLRVMETSIKLANIYGVDIDKASKAALLHDCGKLLSRINLLKMANSFGIILDSVMEDNPDLIHGPLGAKIAEVVYKVEDREILDAIYYHTTGRENMTLLDKIIYIADYIEPNRNFPGLKEIRELAFIDIDQSIMKAMDNSILFLIKTEKLIHLDTIKARNYLKKVSSHREKI